MNFIEALKFLVENTSDEVVRQQASILLETIKKNLKAAESRINPDLSRGGMSDTVTIKVQRGVRQDGDLN